MPNVTAGGIFFMHGEESQVPGDLRQSEILIEQDFRI
jgi:hypothetical protein